MQESLQKDTEDQILLQGIVENDVRILEKIYAQHLPAVAAMVRSNRGSVEDARDVFQEAIVILYKKANEADFTLTTRLGGYLFGVCRLIWLRQLKKKYRTEVTLDGAEGYAVEENMESLLLESEKRQLFQKKLSELGDDCQNVLKRFFAGSALAEIAAQMGYTEDYIKKKNKTCKEKLADLVKKDPRYQELKNNTP